MPFFRSEFSRGDNPGVNFNGLSAAHPFNALFLEKAQQLDLKREGDFTNFIQEKRSADRHFETAFALGMGASERPLLMAEQFTFQTFRNGAAIDGNEGAVLPGAVVMDGPGRHFLACPAFTEKKHGASVVATLRMESNTARIAGLEPDHPCKGVPSHHLLHLTVLDFKTGHMEAAPHGSLSSSLSTGLTRKS